MEEMRSNRNMRVLRGSPFVGPHRHESSRAGTQFILCLLVRLITCANWLVCTTGTISAQQEFLLKDGDTVVFYGDSITERRLYSSFTEAYVLTRFPKLNVRFVNSGWAGDTVAGGAGGPLEVRLKRDVIAYKPTVVTVLLGMNDGHYQPLTETTYADFANGYEKLVNILKAGLPNVRLTLLEPSPHDDVTQPPQFPGGYNGVLTRFGQFLLALGEREKITVVDLNSAVVEPLTSVYLKDPSTAREFIPDRIHPGAAASLLMAEALLKAWNAPAIVTEVDIDAESARANRSVRTQVDSILRTANTLSWTQNDEALPFPVDWQDSPVSVAAYSSDFIPAIDDQPLKVKNLSPGDYTLKIDGLEIATYPADQFARGINLSTFETPMLKQAAEVLKLMNQHNDVHVARWRHVQVPLAQYGLPHYDAAMADLDALEQEAVIRQRATAWPKPHFYEIVPKGSAGRRN
jgi:lysophospholipase L1-like esterase